MHKDLISLIIPVYNGEKHLTKCFSAIENQDYKNLEIIFVDNLSTDNSYNIIQLYCINKKNHIILKCDKKGPSAARNIGLKFSSGKYISFMDVDDSISPDKHSILYETIKKNPQCKIVFGITRKKENDIWLNNNYGKIKVGINKAPATGLLWLGQFQHQVHPGAILVHKTAIEKVGNFPEKLFYGEDIAFMSILGLNYNSFFVEKLVYSKFYISSSATSPANKYMTISERFFHFYKYFALDFFLKRREIEPYNHCFDIVEYDSFKILVRLIKYEKQYKFIKDLHWHSKYCQKNYYYSIRMYLFKNYPIKAANFIYEKFNKFL